MPAAHLTNGKARTPDVPSKVPELVGTRS